MAELFPVDLIDMREECQRELDIRKAVYTTAVRERRMNRRTADRRIDVMAAVVALIDRLISERGGQAHGEGTATVDRGQAD